MKFLLFLCVIIVAGAAQAQVELELQNNGQIADSSPYYCTIRRAGDYAQIWGSGTIISETHVLTAAGLIVKAGGELIVGVGSNRLSLLLFYAVAEFNVHPYFQNADKSHNFAILKLSHALTFGPTVQPAGLPPLGLYGPSFNEQGRIATFNQGTVLKNTFQRVTDYDACSIYRINPEDDSSFCAEQEESDLDNCLYKDMGAAFIVPVFGVDTIVGIAALAGDCLLGTRTTFEYARVSNGREWIHEVTGY